MSDLATIPGVETLVNGGALATGYQPKSDQKQFTRFPDVRYMGEKTKSNLTELAAAGVEPGQFYVVDQAGIVAVKPFQAHLLAHSRFYTQMDNRGEMTDIALELDDDNEMWGDKYRPHMLGLLAVVLTNPDPNVADEYLLAEFSVRNAMLKAFDQMAALTDAKKGGPACNGDAWAKRGPAYAAGKNILWPSFRFTGTLWGTTDPDGDFNLSHVAIKPTPAKNVDAIKQLTGPNYNTRVDPIFRHYVARTQAWINFAKMSDDEKAQTNLPW